MVGKCTGSVRMKSRRYGNRYALVTAPEAAGVAEHRMDRERRLAGSAEPAALAVSEDESSQMTMPYGTISAAAIQ